ncbi:hypothetical protein Salat_2078000 [Sesamum alatum]|uniref:PB1 domain-containing protein n=1 Tax=Sesamum alatum TaxID=300844 RepID=A0AAE1Y066_9LAMI|nr:hypothetical protein Salat_2078000 [Sesamum alatum]
MGFPQVPPHHHRHHPPGPPPLSKSFQSPTTLTYQFSLTPLSLSLDSRYVVSAHIFMACFRKSNDPDSGLPDSVASTPRSDHHHLLHEDTSVAKSSPAPHDNQPPYVGWRHPYRRRPPPQTTFSGLLSKTLQALSFPTRTCDALITVTADEDVENMMEEYDRLSQGQRSARLRLFLFPTDWARGRFLERGRSEKPPQDQKQKPFERNNISMSDPGSPAPVVSSPVLPPRHHRLPHPVNSGSSAGENQTR